MASRTTTTTQTRMAETPQILHLIGSDTISLKQSISQPSDTNLNIHRKGEYQKDHSSFDSESVFPAWYVRPPPNTSRSRFWLKRQYYRYEVTWGLYMLTLGEKVIINSLVFITFSMIAYGIARVMMLQLVCGLITQ
jgi:hypothetical protein